MTQNIVYQLTLSLRLPTIHGPADYHEFREILETDNREYAWIVDDLARCSITSPTHKEIRSRRRMLRCSILKGITSLDYRELSIRLADSTLFQWCAGYHTLDTDSSTIECRYHLFTGYFR